MQDVVVAHAVLAGAVAGLALALVFGLFLLAGRRRRRREGDTDERMRARRRWRRYLVEEARLEELERMERRKARRDAIAWLAATGAFAGRAHGMVTDLIGSIRLTLRERMRRRND